MADTHYVIGVDGGGTSTRALLAAAARSSDGTITVTGVATSRTACPSNPVVSGRAAAYAAIDMTIRNVLLEAGINPAAVSGVCLAIAGLGAETEKAAMRDWFHSCVPNGGAAASDNFARTSLRIATDAEAVMAMCHQSHSAAVLIAGTGSVALARSMTGDMVQAGGWGPVTDDPGSGYWIAVQALRRSCRMADGREKDTGLGDAFVKHFSAATLRDVCDTIHSGQIDRRTLAASAAVVSERCEEGDPAAIEIRAAAANHLADLLIAAVRNCRGMEEPWMIKRAGGLFGDNRLSDLVSARLTQQYPNLESQGRQWLVISAEQGAAQLAAEQILQPAIECFIGSSQHAGDPIRRRPD